MESLKWLKSIFCRAFIPVILISNILFVVVTGNDSDDSDSAQKTNASITTEGASSTGIEVELSIVAANLSRADLISKSDPMCVIQTQKFGTSEWTFYGRTERVQNEHNPIFNTKIRITYKFEEQQPLLFQIYDIDSESANLEEHRLLGFANCVLGELVYRGELTLKLQKKGFLGGVKYTESSITIRATEFVKNNYDEVIMELNGKDLEDKDWIGKSDPLIEIYNHTGSVIYTTEVKNNNLNPRWKRFFIPVTNLCDGDYDQPLKFMCWNSNSIVSRDRIGEFQTTLNELKNQDERVFELINEEKKENNEDYQNSGKVHVVFFKIVTVRSLIEYFRAGLKIDCTIAIDFTDSNGDPSDSNSLHYINSSKDVFNHYEQAISSIVSTIEHYSPDKLFTAFGFGAKLPSEELISHDFNLTMSDSTPFCTGVHGILEAYRNCVTQIRFDEMRKFAPVIQRVINSARTLENGYHILLILTRGNSVDMAETKEAIIQASGLPISIIVVGFGDAEFEDVETLSTKRLQVEDAEAQRDIVRFVRLDNFLSRGDLRTAGQHLAREALAKIPEQIVSYKVTA